MLRPSDGGDNPPEPETHTNSITEYKDYDGSVAISELTFTQTEGQENIQVSIGIVNNLASDSIEVTNIVITPDNCEYISIDYAGIIPVGSTTYVTTYVTDPGVMEATDYTIDKFEYTEIIEPTDTFKVTFESIDVPYGTDASYAIPEYEDVIMGDLAYAPQEPTNPGYTFAGWYPDTQYDNPFDFANTPINEDITLYAKWDINNVDVSIKAIVASQTPAGNLTLTDTNDVTTTVSEDADGYYQFQIQSDRQLSDVYPTIEFEDISANFPTIAEITGNTLAFLYDEDVMTNSISAGTVDLDRINTSLSDTVFTGAMISATLTYNQDYAITVGYVPVTGEYPASGDTEYLATLYYNGINVYAYGIPEEVGVTEGSNYYEYFVTDEFGNFWKIRVTCNDGFIDWSTSADTEVPINVADAIASFKMFVNGAELTMTDYNEASL